MTTAPKLHLLLTFLAFAALPLLAHADQPACAPPELAAKPSSGCAATLEELQVILNGFSEPPMVIDLRSPGDYRSLRAFGAVNLPAFSLPVRGHLKERSLLLYDRPARRKQVQSTCEELKSNGFSKVTVVPFGLLGWQKLNQELEGDTSLLSREKIISINDFFSEISDRAWLLINVSNEDTLKDLPSLAVQQLASGTDREKLRIQLRDLIHTHRLKAPQIRVALFGAGKNIAQESDFLRDLIFPFDDPGIFILPDGAAGINHYLEQNKKIVEELSKPPARSSCGQ